MSENKSELELKAELFDIIELQARHQAEIAGLEKVKTQKFEELSKLRTEQQPSTEAK